jgi:hypothetical protein
MSIANLLRRGPARVRPYLTLLSVSLILSACGVLPGAVTTYVDAPQDPALIVGECLRWDPTAADPYVSADCSQANVYRVESGLEEDLKTVRGCANPVKVVGGVLKFTDGSPDEISFAHYCLGSP